MAKHIFFILSSCRYCTDSSDRALEQLFSPWFTFLLNLLLRDWRVFLLGVIWDHSTRNLSLLIARPRSLWTCLPRWELWHGFDDRLLTRWSHSLWLEWPSPQLFPWCTIVLAVIAQNIGQRLFQVHKHAFLYLLCSQYKYKFYSVIKSFVIALQLKRFHICSPRRITLKFCEE